MGLTPMIKLVAFDWNGTILSDTNLVLKSENVVWQHYGYTPISLKEYQEIYTIPIRDYFMARGVSAEFFDQNAEKIHTMFLNSYEPGESKTRSRSGSREVLRWLKENKIESAIFSNHIVPHIEKQLSRLKLEDYFTVVLARELGSFSHMKSRGKKDKLASYVQSRNYRPEEVVTIGDTLEEVEIAKELGYYSVALSGGYQSIKRLKSGKPDYVINNLKQLKDIIIEINGRTT
jgi:phosphoglycolate phosphatase